MNTQEGKQGNFESTSFENTGFEVDRLEKTDFELTPDKVNPMEAPTEPLINETHSPDLLLSQRCLTQHADHTSLVLIARVNCPHFCDLRGTKVQLQSSSGEIWEIPLTAFNGVENETNDIMVETGSTAGTYSWTASYAYSDTEGLEHSETVSEFSYDYQPHRLSLATWDIPFPATIAEAISLKLGAKCSSGCSVEGSPIRVYDKEDKLICEATIGNEPWPASQSLYWTEISFDAPKQPGTYTYRAEIEIADHPVTQTSFSLLAANKPEYTLSITVSDKDTKQPLPQASIAMHPYKTTTDEFGFASIPAAAQGDLKIYADNYEDECVHLMVTGDTSFSVELQEKPENLGDF